ncbi:MAG TPA: ATP-binding protein [Candidatus Eremiobacteraceae bacterium]
MNDLQARIFAAMACVCAVTLLAVGIFSTRETTMQFEQFSTAAHVPPVAGMQSSLSSFYARKASWSGIAPVLQDIARREKIGILLFSGNGELIASSLADLVSARMDAARDGTRLLLNRGSSGNHGQEELRFQGPATTVLFRGRVVGEIFVLPQPAGPSSIAPLSAGVNRSLWLAIAIALGAALIASIVLARSIARPLVTLTRAAELIASGDLLVRVPVHGRGEIAVLSKSFNALVTEIERTENLRRQMVSDVAHELRSPLTNLKAQIEAIQDGHLNADQAVGSLHDDVSALEHLVDDLRDLSLADVGQLEINPKRLNVRATIDLIVRSAVRSGFERQVSVVNHVAADLPDVFADPIRVRQILMNLTDNAVRCTPVGGNVLIGAASTGATIEIFVQDAGPGISAEHLPQVFERFYRIDQSRARSTGGAGLGLAIVKQLAELQGGSVSVVSGDGTGSRFTVTLPRAENAKR